MNLVLHLVLYIPINAFHKWFHLIVFYKYILVGKQCSCKVMAKRINSKRIHYQKVILDIFLQFFVLVICIIRNDWNRQTFYIAFCKIYSVPYIYQSGLSPKYRFVLWGFGPVSTVVT